MKKALITGITGQDGYYLVELLISKGYLVSGTSRGIGEINGKGFESPTLGQVKMLNWDLKNIEEFQHILVSEKPDEIYNFAAFSSGADMFKNPIELSEINGISVLKMLESIRNFDINIKFCQASSREVYGDPSESPLSENSLMLPRSPYGAAKLFADNIIKMYRNQYGMYCCSAILFNHESPRRRMEFVTKKIVNAAVRIKLGLQKSLSLGNLETIRDWGHAKDYVAAMWLMLQQEDADDYVVASDEGRTVRDFCEAVFNALNLNYLEYVVGDDADSLRPSEKFPLIGCSKKIIKKLGWQREFNFEELISDMIMSELKQQNLIKSGN